MSVLFMNDVRHANLTGEQDVLTGLGHRAVGSRHNQDSAVHLGSTGNHVLNIVSVAGAVHVSVVAGSRLVLNVSGVNRDATGLFFRRLVDFVITHRLRFALLGQRHGDGGGQGRLAMVNVTDGADVNVGLFALVTFLSHWNFLLYVRVKLRRYLRCFPAADAVVEQAMGIEPTRPAWEAGVLPLNYACMSRIKPNQTCQTRYIVNI